MSSHTLFPISLPISPVQSRFTQKHTRSLTLSRELVWSAHARLPGARPHTSAAPLPLVLSNHTCRALKPHAPCLALPCLVPAWRCWSVSAEGGCTPCAGPSRLLVSITRPVLMLDRLESQARRVLAPSLADDGMLEPLASCATHAGPLMLRRSRWRAGVPNARGSCPRRPWRQA